MPPDKLCPYCGCLSKAMKYVKVLKKSKIKHVIHCEHCGCRLDSPEYFATKI